MKKLFFLLVAFSLFRTSPAVAVNASYFKTGNELLNECKEFLKLEDKTDMSAGNCIGFIEGATDIHNTLVDSLYIKPIYCFPQNVQSGQLVRVVLKYLVEYPELLNAPASHLVLNSFKEAFPCPESQPSK